MHGTRIRLQGLWQLYWTLRLMMRLGEEEMLLEKGRGQIQEG